MTINGTGFTSPSAVKFNGVAAASFASVSSTQIRATVPATATTGRISVTTAAGTVFSPSYFTKT